MKLSKNGANAIAAAVAMAIMAWSFPALGQGGNIRRRK